MLMYCTQDESAAKQNQKYTETPVRISNHFLIMNAFLFYENAHHHKQHKTILPASAFRQRDETHLLFYS